MYVKKNMPILCFTFSAVRFVSLQQSALPDLILLQLPVTGLRLQNTVTIQERSLNIASGHIKKLKLIYYFYFSFKFSTRNGAIANKGKYTMAQLLTEKKKY